MNILTQNNQQSMTSQQIAELVGSRHDKVKQSIERLATDRELKPAVIALPPMGVVQIMTNNRFYDTDVYIFTGEQGKRDSIVVVAQLSPEFTAALVDRWQALEAQTSAPVIPQTLSQALRLAADQADLIDQQNERLALVEPKAAALDVIDSAMGSLNARDTAKSLGIQPQKFNAWCIAHNWMYRDGKDKLQMDSLRMKQGFMEQRPVTYKVKVNHNGATFYETRATTQPLFTPKGLTHLAKTFAIVHEVA
ncbi:phage antirepressor KilAC domain-containing protein [Psychrobacter sp. PAMC 21119]|uniref:phage antirepressor KilAC domain-containing protein n=1 Tax=Psychrobacter sp. PAMC 21119 TaxID=1112209 RepID=UPI0002896DDB|nr:phage antirepressor KilAC domain-containing protein [Psychrobacter sp. PAMC 21119]